MRVRARVRARVRVRVRAGVKVRVKVRVRVTGGRLVRHVPKAEAVTCRLSQLVLRWG